MKYYILHLFGGKDPSLGLPHATLGERKYWAQHWWERECGRGSHGDRGYIVDQYPNGLIKMKEITECYKDNIWKTDYPGHEMDHV